MLGNRTLRPNQAQSVLSVKGYNCPGKNLRRKAERQTITVQCEKQSNEWACFPVLTCASSYSQCMSASNFGGLKISFSLVINLASWRNYNFSCFEKFEHTLLCLWASGYTWILRFRCHRWSMCAFLKFPTWRLSFKYVGISLYCPEFKYEWSTRPTLSSKGHPYVMSAQYAQHFVSSTSAF